MLSDEVVGGLKERRLRTDRGVPPFQVIDEPAHRILLLRRQRPDHISQVLCAHSVSPTAVYRACRDTRDSHQPNSDDSSKSSSRKPHGKMGSSKPPSEHHSKISRYRTAQPQQNTGTTEPAGRNVELAPHRGFDQPGPLRHAAEHRRRFARNLSGHGMSRRPEFSPADLSLKSMD